MSEHYPTTLALDPAGFDAVIFDLDGVITNTARVHAAAWKQVFDAYLEQRDEQESGAPRPFTYDDYRRYVDGRQREDGVESFLSARGIQLPRGDRRDSPDRETVWGIANRKDRAFQRVIAEQGVDTFTSSVALVHDLHARGITTAIVSASRNCQRILEIAGIGDLFHARVDGIDAEGMHLAGKPSPALFVEAARRLGVIRARTAIVEDALAGVEAGRRGGFGLVIGVNRARDERSLVESGADVVVSDLAQIEISDIPPEDDSGPVAATAIPPEWSLVIEGFNRDLEPLHGALLTLADGRVGIHYSSVRPQTSVPWAAMLGVYDADGPGTHLLPAPGLIGPWPEPAASARWRRILDLRYGVLHETIATRSGHMSSISFASLARPGTVAIRVEGSGATAGVELQAPGGPDDVEDGRVGATAWMRVSGSAAGIVAALHGTPSGASGSPREWIAVYEGDSTGVRELQPVVSKVEALAGNEIAGLLADQRSAWAPRWDDADISIEGAPDLQASVRFGLYHLMATAPDQGEAAIGARGLTGPGYRGHVFWDADAFVLPFFAATRPAAARAMLTYRIRRLPAAIRAARAAGRAGARFPWESAATGDDVTPRSARTRTGETVAIRTGQLEEHIVAEVAWAACCYIDWTGDDDFARGGGMHLLVSTARYWSSRIRVDPSGVGHIYGVIGPDEYHEPVDDNAFTNVMARWNLRRAADAVDAAPRAVGATVGEVSRWRELADRLLDGYDPNTGIYEQFAGFHELEPLVIEEVAPRRPIAADLLLGMERVRGAQIVKQADVLMLHHLVPDEVEPDTLEANLRYYEPRTAHGSSLSPAIHAALFARARDFGPALDALAVASRIDLDDLTATSADGLHIATMGGLWQAFAYGFFGLRPQGARLALDPRLPPSWGALEIRLHFRSSRVIVRLESQRLVLRADPQLGVLVRSTPFAATPNGLELEREGDRWRHSR
jgi:beta-phosphoglucomutase family hydrolase